MRPRDLARLVRLPLVISALGDPVAGLYLAGGTAPLPYLGVAAAAAFLYLGGMALNDVFDFDVDRREHPRRVLPSGAVAPSEALAVGAACLTAGVTVASFVSLPCSATALALAAAILGYDAGLKRRAVPGCLVMGLCRGLNVLLGAAAEAGFPPPTVVLAAAGIHTAYIAGITALSRLEDRPRPAAARQLWPGVLPALAALAAVPVLVALHPLAALVPLALLAARLASTLAAARHRPSRAAWTAVVGAGVRGVLLVDVAYLWGAGGWWAGAAGFALYAFSHLRGW